MRPTWLPESATTTVRQPAAILSVMPGSVSPNFTTALGGHLSEHAKTDLADSHLLAVCHARPARRRTVGCRHRSCPSRRLCVGRAHDGKPHGNSCEDVPVTHAVEVRHQCPSPYEQPDFGTASHTGPNPKPVGRRSARNTRRWSRAARRVRMVVVAACSTARSWRLTGSFHMTPRALCRTRIGRLSAHPRHEPPARPHRRPLPAAEGEADAAVADAVEDRRADQHGVCPRRPDAGPCARAPRRAWHRAGRPARPHGFCHSRITNIGMRR